jgi:hypothetical protein
MIPHMEELRSDLSPDELQQQLNEAFVRVRATERRGIARPPPEPPPKLTPEEIQQRCNELFGDMPSRHEPTPPPRGPDPATPEELQQRLNEAFAGVLSNGGTLRTQPKPQVESPRAPISPEELQQRLSEHFGNSRPLPGATLSPRRLRSLFRAGNPATGGPSRRQRCDARVKNLFRIGKNGVTVPRGLFCKGWAMENGRCWVHGGASTGPRTPEGKARVVAAMVEGRRKWVERQRAEGKKFPAGRKGGERWVTEPMRGRARAEAHRLKGGRFTLERSLTLALLRSAHGCLESNAKAKAMLDANEQAEADRDLGQALSVVRDLRASAIAGWSGGAPVPTTLRYAEVGPNGYAPAPYSPTGSGGDPTTPADKLQRNLLLALDRLEEIMMGKALDRNVRDKRLALEAATATI